MANPCSWRSLKHLGKERRVRAERSRIAFGRKRLGRGAATYHKNHFDARSGFTNARFLSALPQFRLDALRRWPVSIFLPSRRATLSETDSRLSSSGSISPFSLRTPSSTPQNSGVDLRAPNCRVD